MKEAFRGLYKGKKVLVTGHTGFKGSWLCIWLKELGADVIGYSLDPPSSPNAFEACKLKDRVVHVHGDIRDFNRLKLAFEQYKPEIVFHLAAQSLVRFSYEEPRLTYETNVLGTVNLFEAIRNADSVRVVVNVTSDKCYENREWVWGYREDDPLGGRDPYSSSKGCAEIATSAWVRSYFPPQRYHEHGIAVASVRAGNVIGGGDWGTDRLLPDCINALVAGKPIVIRNPNAIRPWQYVLELLSGYLLLGKRLWEAGPDFVGAWNFGPSDDQFWTVEAVTRKVIETWGTGKYEIRKDGSTPHEAQVLKLECSKVRKYLGWRPRHSLGWGIGQTVEWYRNFYEGGNSDSMWNVTTRQIRNYAKVAKQEE